MSSGLKALEYAEQQLGVHEVHVEAQVLGETLKVILQSLVNMRSKKRNLEDQVTEQEMVIASEEWGKHPDMSAARMESHLKVAKQKDPILRELREQLRGLAFDMDTAESERTACEADMRTAVGRLHELGGYFQYLAAVKMANQDNTA